MTMTGDPYREGDASLFKPAKLAHAGYVWMPKHPIDWKRTPRACLQSANERVHRADFGEYTCVCYEQRDTAWGWVTLLWRVLTD